MAWPEFSEADAFPPPRREEPAQLRQDILDELSDHLALAAQRERNTGIDNDSEIWARVLDRFGDPRAVARQLWWDAIKEEVMRDYIKTAVIVLVGLAMIVFIVASFQQLQSTNREILLALKEQTPQAAPPTLAQLNMVLRRGSESGPPAAGVAMKVAGKLFGEEEVEHESVTDAEGRFQIGPVKPGIFTIAMDDPESGLSRQEKVTVFAGQGAEAHCIIAPNIAPMVEAEFDLGLPAHADDAFQLIKLSLNSSWESGGFRWTAFRTIFAGREGFYSIDGAVPGMMRPPRQSSGLQFKVSQGMRGYRRGEDAVKTVLLPRTRLAASIIPAIDAEGRGMFLELLKIDPLSAYEAKLETVEFDVGNEQQPRFSISMPEEMDHIVRALARARLNSRVLGGDWQLPFRLADQFDAVAVKKIASVRSGGAWLNADDVAQAMLFFKPQEDGFAFRLQGMDLKHSDCRPGVFFLFPCPADTAPEKRYVLSVDAYIRKGKPLSNTLLAYGIRSEWPQEAPAAVTLDAEPFMRRSANDLNEETPLIIEMTGRIRDSQEGETLHGVFLCWEKNTGNAALETLEMSVGNDRMCQIVTLCPVDVCPPADESETAMDASGELPQS